ncbi:MAG: anti-sigma factor family protein [Acidimicrobiia bacterium]
MTRDSLNAELSRYFDGDLTPAEAKSVERLLASSEEARAYLEQIRALRRQLRYEAADPGPDVTSRVLTAIDRASRPRRVRVAAAFAAGVLGGAVFIGLALRQPTPVATAGIPDQVLAAQADVDAMTAHLRIVESGWHPEVAERVFTGRVQYRAPESLLVEISDETSYPSKDWFPNDSMHVIDEDIAWSSSVAGCPMEALPECTPSEPRVVVQSDREPFPDAVPAPLDLVVPVAGFSRAGEPRALGNDTIDGRAAVGVEVSVAQAGALLDGLTAIGNWRQFHPTDRVELWLDQTVLVPLALYVFPADTDDRELWAIRKGYDDSPGTPILEVIWSDVTVNGNDPIRLPSPPAHADTSSFGFHDGPVEMSLVTADIPLGMSLHRTGTIETGAGPPVSVASWSDGRAWFKIRWTANWESNRLFGDLGPLVRRSQVGPGVGYLDEQGDRVGLHANGLDAIVLGSLPTPALVEVAGSLDIVGEPVPGTWVESATSTVEVAAETLEGLLVPESLHGFGTPTIRVEDGVVTMAYAGAGNRGFLLTEAVDDRLSPPMEAKVRAVTVRGIEGRYIPERGLLEWVEGEITVSLTSTTLTLDELLTIARMLGEP